MKFVAVIGPHGAGKDTLIPEVVKLFEKENPGLLKRAIFTLSRLPREGELNGVNHFFVSKDEFMAMVKDGRINYYEPIADYLAGTMVSELKKGENVIANITLSGVEGNKNIFDPVKDKIFTILVDAPLEQRRQRMIRRSLSLDEKYLDFRIRSDPSANLNKEDFNLYINNTDGNLENSVQQAYLAIKKIYFMNYAKTHP